MYSPPRIVDERGNTSIDFKQYCECEIIYLMYTTKGAPQLSAKVIDSLYQHLIGTSPFKNLVIVKKV